MFLASFLSALLVVAGLLGYRAYRKRLRKIRFAGLELRPNCLLTRYPIVFVSNRPSLLNPFDHWDDVPLFLREHGYEVAILECPGKTWTTSFLERACHGFGQKFHLIGDSKTQTVIEDLATRSVPFCVSMTVVAKSGHACADSIERSQWRPEDLKPRRSAIEIFEVGTAVPEKPILVNPSSWKFEERFLELAISLAERDAQWSD